MPYQTVGNLNINFHHEAQAVDYYRELDIQNAKSSVKYSTMAYAIRANICHGSRQVIAVRLTASKKARCRLH
jgi:hypothetical protein